MSTSDKRVLVAMSGGVDSSVAAALLVRQGWEVMGATLQLQPCEDRGLARSCCGADAVLNARRVANQLGIDHVLIDCRNEFREQVLRPSWDEYARGRTPSPCILCNQRIKLGLLADKAKRFGASKVATGHYARIVGEPGARSIARGANAAKDQSYFLCALDHAQLDLLLFPLVELSKPEVRSIARELGLASAERVESQDACFGTGEGLADALRLRFDAEARGGPIVDPRGRLLGRHDGLHRFTVGQRHGLGLALGARAFVCQLRDEDAAVVVSTDQRDVWADGLSMRPMDDRPTPERCLAQIRSRHKAAPARAQRASDGLVEVWFDEPQRAVSPGQAAVLYDGERVAAAGWIERALSRPR